MASGGTGRPDVTVCETRSVSTRRLSTTDGFVVVDLDDAPESFGVLRSAPKVLVDGATWLARSQTYQFAVFGRRASGASGAVNAPADAKVEAIATAVVELGGDDWSSVHLTAGRGVSASDLASLRAVDPRPDGWFDDRDGAVVAGIVAAAERALGGLSGVRVAVEEFDATGPLLAAALAASGATAVEIDSSLGADAVVHADADVLFLGSKVGLLGDALVPHVRARTIVPSGPMPVTAKALAALGRAGVTVLPDVITTAGHLALWPQDGSSTDPAALVADRLASVLDHPRGPLVGACELAEDFLGTWTTVPFGRPIA